MKYAKLYIMFFPLTLQVSYETAFIVRENFTDISSIILDNMVTKAPSIAFLDLKKVCTLFSC